MAAKFWLDSTTVRASLITILPAALMLLKAFHVEIGEGEANSIVDGLAALVGLVGAVVAIYGRLKATHTLTLENPNK